MKKTIIAFMVLCSMSALVVEAQSTSPQGPIGQMSVEEARTSLQLIKQEVMQIHLMQEMLDQDLEEINKFKKPPVAEKPVLRHTNTWDCPLCAQKRVEKKAHQGEEGRSKHRGCGLLVVIVTLVIFVMLVLFGTSPEPRES